MALFYFLICLFLISIGSFTKNFNYVQLLLLPMGLIAVLFQKYIHKGKIRELGFKRCSLKQMVEAFVLPLAIILTIFIADFILRLVRIRPLAEVKNPFVRDQIGVGFWTLLLIIFISAFFTFLGSLITEELGFRGYLIGRFKKFGNMEALMLSSFLFGLWHLPPSLLILRSGPGRSATYVFNIFLLGIIFGYLFLESKSLFPPSLCHGVWNALEYTLFGYGNVEGVFSGRLRIVFDPEEGLVGTAALLVVAIFFLWKMKKRYGFLNAKPDLESLINLKMQDS
jgi:membrane protease YdiL (CAAX protease family)